ncbi:MAG: hypothetical protein P3X22_003335 [Thermoprotei archaeon]|nr:hypothetical protein [Thermoprotei archaeon]
MRKTVSVDMGRYKSVEVSLEESERLLMEVSRQLGLESQDLDEALRVLRNFDSFYDMARRKFKDYIIPSKSLNDMIRGAVIVDKLKLIKEGDERRVVITFDRRVKEEVIVEALKKLGYEADIRKLELY